MWQSEPVESTRKAMPGRLLRLLALLQSRREWSGRELAERLGVTERTMRRDIDRLRALDYSVNSVSGTAGGYRLASGKNLPPFLLDDEEALAVAVGLVTAAAGSVAGIGESSVRALAKLEQVLPARLRPRLTALTSTAAAVPHRRQSSIDTNTLAAIALCCREREVVTFDYRSMAGESSARRAEPHHLVTLEGLWYLLAYDPQRSDWRTFRVDRIDRPSRTHRHFTPRELPAPDAVTYLTRSFAGARYRYTAWITVGMSAEALRSSELLSIAGHIEERGPQESAIRVSADSADLVTQYIAAITALGVEFTIDAPAEIIQRVRQLGRRLAE